MLPKSWRWAESEAVIKLKRKKQETTVQFALGLLCDPFSTFFIACAQLWHINRLLI